MADGPALPPQKVHLACNLGDGVHAVDADAVCVGGVVARCAREVAARKDGARALAARREAAEHLRGALDMRRERFVTVRGGRMRELPRARGTLELEKRLVEAVHARGGLREKVRRARHGWARMRRG